MDDLVLISAALCGCGHVHELASALVV